MAGHNLNEFFFLYQEEIVVLLGLEKKTLDSRGLDPCALTSNKQLCEETACAGAETSTKRDSIQSVYSPL